MYLITFFALVHFIFNPDNNSPKTIHVFVALCDNENQGIVPVPEHLGKGDQSGTNLYWGAAYGVKSYFKNKTSDWKLVKTDKPQGNFILERIAFKHRVENVYLLADAYNGARIKRCIEDFLLASNGQNKVQVEINNEKLNFGGSSNLLAYVGHDGLMDFAVNPEYKNVDGPGKDAIVLACYSKNFFSDHIKAAKATPILWTTHLMAPEAYTLKAAIDGWMRHETGEQIDERAAQAYHQYQKCGMRGARNLFTTGF